MSPASFTLNLDNAVYYHDGKFPPLQLDYAKLMQPFSGAASAIARYDQMLKTMRSSEIFLAPLRNQEAVISSRMEGTVSTMDEILQYEADYEEGSVDLSNTRSEVIETYLYQRALKSCQHAIEDGQPFSPVLIRMAHRELLSVGRGASKSPGQYKTEQNYLSEKNKRNICFVPISPERLQDGIDRLFQYILHSDHVPLIRAGIAHLEFEALHPFKDGNGRIGRMMITLLLWQFGVISAPHFYISGYFEAHKDQYIDTMRQVSQTGDWTSWCAFFLDAVEYQATKNLEAAENIRDLYEKMKAQFSELLSSKWSVNALDFIFANPVFRNAKFTKNGRIPEATAARFTRMLEESGLLTVLEKSSGRRSTLYRFEPLMELVRV